MYLLVEWHLWGRKKTAESDVTTEKTTMSLDLAFHALVRFLFQQEELVISAPCRHFDLFLSVFSLPG